MAAARTVLALLALVCVAQAGIVLLLDDFEANTMDRQLIVETLSPPFPVTVQDILTPTSSIVGNERDISILINNAANGQTYTTSVGAGRWTIFTPSGDVIESSATYQLDGVDGTAFAIDVNNLNIDFTQSGNAFQLEITGSSDQDTNFLFTAFSAGDISTTAEFDLFIPAGSLDDPFVLPFASWNADPGFSFSSVGALEIVANVNEETEVDADVSFLGITVNIIDGVVFFDCNQDGVENLSEVGYPNVEVNLLDSVGTVLDTTFTDINGEYTFFTGPGTYEVCLEPTTFADPTIPVTGCSGLFSLASGEDRFGDTFGCYVPVDVVAPLDDSVDCTECTSASGACTGVATATGCDGSVTVSFSDSIVSFCVDTFTITRTWTATDTFSSDSDVQIILVSDNAAPVFTSFPNDVVVGCGESINPADIGTPTATDNCNTATVSYFDDSSSGCTAPINREWTASDQCGNSVTNTQLVTVSDQDPPVFQFQPADTTVECGSSTDPSSTGVATAIDACAVGPTVVTFSDGNISGSCPETFTRTWTATDACNNIAVYQQFISVDDTIAPNLNVPATASVPCGASTAPADTNGPATASDSCDTTPFITFTDSTSGDSCTSGIQRVWTASDGCNTSSGTQQINISDNVDPTFTSFPADTTVDCSASTDPINTGSPSAQDSCSGLDVITFSDSLPTGNSCSRAFSRVWAATDFCDNQVTSIQIITAVDTTDPVLIIPNDISIDCNDSTSTASTGVASATDDCSGASITDSTVLVSSDGCTDVYERTFTATDGCGFTDVGTQRITATDDTDPSFSFFPADASVPCQSEGGADISPSNTGGSAVGIDNCDNFPFVTFSDVETNNLCPDGIDVQRTWTVTDSCANSFSQVQEIDIFNNFNPIVIAPNNVAIDCGASSDPSATGGDATVTGVCDPQLTVTFSDSISGNGCNQLITRTWSATNACGNTGSDVQTITLTDNAAPVMNPFPSDVSIGCEQGSSPMETGTPTVADNCDPSPTLSFSDSISQPPPANGVCPSPITVTRTWFTGDACGNTATQTQTIVVSQEAPTQCIPVECAPVPCDTSDCPTSDCSCCSDEVTECTPVDCTAAPCAAVPCTAVPCTNCPTSSSAGSVGCTPVACQPVTIYFDDDDYYENQDLINAFRNQQQ